MAQFRDYIVTIAGTLMIGACAPAGSSVGFATPAGDDQTNTPTSAPPDSSQPVTTAPIAARPSNAANLVVCPEQNTEPGFDVSDYDPNTNWPKVAAGGQSFAFIKASEGITYINPIFAADWANAKTAGVIRGAYHFFHADDDPTSQATTFLRTVGDLGLNDLPAVLDWEVTDNQSNATQISRAKTWLQLVEAATGRIPIIYTSASFFNDLGNPQGFERYPLFVAEYEVSCPKVPPPWSKWAFWQKAETGGVSGVTSKDVDQDVFDGTLTQLAQFLATGAF